MPTDIRWEPHLPDDCIECSALGSVAGPLDLVLHCTAHGPYLYPPHSDGGQCPECAWDTPFARFVLDALRRPARADGTG